jgi:UDP-glucose 4-epimerase
MKLKILITGGCGFIGKNISNYLINFKNYKIIVVDDLSSGNSNLLNNKIKIYKQKIDLIHLEKIIKKHRINHIIHCAAHFANQNSIENPYIDLKTNILGSLNVLNIAKKFKIKKLINLSSSCVYDNFRSNENSIKPSNKTPYAISKFAAEQYSSFFKNFYNMNIINLRLFNIYGPYDYYGKYRNVIPNFINAALKNNKIEIHGDGLSTRDFTYVKDLCRAIKIILSKKKVNGTYNFGSSKQINIKNLTKKIIFFSKSESQIKFIKTRSWDIKSRRISNNIKFKREFKGFNFTKINEGLKETISWFKKNNY